MCYYRIKTACGRVKVDIDQLDRGDAATGTVMAEFLDFEKSQVTLGENATMVALPRADGTPGIAMPFRKETFTGSERVFQGRLYRGEGPKYWGTSMQNVSDDTVKGALCNDRYTYLMFTNMDSANSTGKVTLTVVDKVDIAESIAKYLGVSIVAFLILLI